MSSISSHGDMQGGTQDQMQYDIISDPALWREQTPGDLSQVLMGPVLQETLFGTVATGLMDASTFDRAYATISTAIAPYLGLREASRIAFFQVNDPLIMRYHLSAYVEHDDGVLTFLKVGRGAAANASLQFESAALVAAHESGYPPTLRVRTPYTELANGVSFIELEGIRFGRDGFTALANPRARRFIAPEWGRIAAETMLRGFGRALPPTVDASSLRLAEREIESADVYFAAFLAEQRQILAQPFYGEVEHLVGQVAKHESAHVRLERLFDEVNEGLPALVYPYEGTGHWYLCVNDVAPHTMLFCSEEGTTRFGSPVVLYFLGGGGKASNALLTSMYDWGNFVARCDPNHHLQQTFLHTLLRHEPLGNLEDSYRFLRYMFVARSVFAAYFLMDPALPRHGIAASLLKNLFPNLGRFRAAYDDLRAIQRAV